MFSIAEFLATKNTPSCASFFESYSAKEPKLYKHLLCMFNITVGG